MHHTEHTHTVGGITQNTHASKGWFLVATPRDTLRSVVGLLANVRSLSFIHSPSVVQVGFDIVTYKTIRRLVEKCVCLLSVLNCLSHDSLDLVSPLSDDFCFRIVVSDLTPVWFYLCLLALLASNGKAILYPTSCTSIPRRCEIVRIHATQSPVLLQFRSALLVCDCVIV
jgi:hypothetical protein